MSEWMNVWEAETLRGAIERDMAIQLEIEVEP